MTKEELLQLAEKSGTGHYFFLSNNLVQNIDEIGEAFGPQFELAYSIKANYYQGVLNQLLEKGLSFDCASLMELKKLLGMQVPSDRIWVNTPFLNEELLATSFSENVMLVADSVEQLSQMAKHASLSGKSQNVGLRLNFPALEQSRFGIELTEDTLTEVHELLENPHLKLRKLHTHFSGTVRSTEAFGKRVKNLIAVYKESFADSPLERLNVGGGMAGTMPASLAAQFDYTIPSWTDYAQVARDLVANELPESLRLTLEPGMALVSDTFGFLAEVVSLKRVGDRSIALLNTCNLFLKPTGHKKYLPFSVINLSDSEAQRHELVGITCMESDLLGIYEGPLSPGDLVAFENVGAYTQSYRPDFIFEAPAIIEV